MNLVHEWVMFNEFIHCLYYIYRVWWKGGGGAQEYIVRSFFGQTIVGQTIAILTIVRLTIAVQTIVRLTIAILTIVRLTIAILTIVRLTIAILPIVRLTIAILPIVRLTILLLDWQLFNRQFSFLNLNIDVP